MNGKKGGDLPLSILVFLLALGFLEAAEILDVRYQRLVLTGIVREIGVAFLVSLIVWRMFEAYRSETTDAEWKRRIEAATKNVFLAVLQKDLPKELINVGRELVFDSTLLRSNFQVHYTLRDDTWNRNGNAVNCVLLEAVLEYRLTNITDATVSFQPALMLPDPVHRELRRKVSVRDFRVKGSGGANLDIGLGEALVKFQNILSSEIPAGTTQIKFEAQGIRIEARDTVDVTATYVMAKESEDSELLQTAYPSSGISVTVADCGAKRRSLSFRSVHPRDLEFNDATGTISLSLKDWLLPHQGVLIWWKSK